MELFFDTVIVSLEQAYALLLDRTISAPLYFVYAQLMRTGYVVELFNKANDLRSTATCSADASTKRAYIWHCLYECLGQKQPATRMELKRNPSADDPIYLETKKLFNDMDECIRTQVSVSSVSDDGDGENWLHGARLKGKPINTPKKSKRKLCTTNKSAPLDILLPEIDAAFQSVFEKLQFIQLTPMEQGMTDDESMMDEISFDFDLFDANTNYRKSDPGLPAYRVIVIDTATQSPAQNPAPSIQAVSRCYFGQRHRVPVLIVFVNDTMAMQAFLYRL